MNVHFTSSSQPNPITRRQFMRTSARAAVAVSALTTAPFVARGRVIGANDRIGVGFIGVGGRGRSHVANVQKLIKAGENLQITAISDTYRFRLNEVTKLTRAKGYMKYQELLADENVDAVLIASPDRLHVPQALEAIRAGKDVYCEKPMGHWSQFALSKEFFKETLRLKRVVQIGNQGNSSQAWKIVADLIQQGAVGRVSHIQAGYYRDGDWGERMRIPDPEAKPGPDLDWEAFLGDAPKVPFTVDRYFSWRKYLDYAGGPCTDLFPHVFTPFVGLFELKFPSLVVASGGIFKYHTYDREVPDTFNTSFDYADQKLTVNLTCTLANKFQTEPAIRGDEGTITLQNPKFETGFDTVTVTPRTGSPKVIPGENPDSTRKHWENFLHCVRTREKPVSDVEFGFHVQAALNMAMLAFLKKKVAQFDFAKEEIIL